MYARACVCVLGDVGVREDVQQRQTENRNVRKENYMLVCNK